MDGKSRQLFVFRMLAIATVLTLSFAFLPLKQVEASTLRLGGVDLQRYCSQKYVRPQGYVVLVSRDAGGWRCQVGTVRLSISVNDACKWQYSSQRNVLAHTDNWSDPYSWHCDLSFNDNYDLRS